MRQSGINRYEVTMNYGTMNLYKVCFFFLNGSPKIVSIHEKKKFNQSFIYFEESLCCLNCVRVGCLFFFSKESADYRSIPID